MLNRTQFQTLVIRPTLKHLDLWSSAAEQLVLGTALVESKLTYLHQVGGGPALGLYQCEPATLIDIFTNFLSHNKGLAAKVNSLTAPGMTLGDNLVGNAFFSTAICRVHYRRMTAPLPEAGDVPAMGAYWKRYYNTEKGAGKVERFRPRLATGMTHCPHCRTRMEDGVTICVDCGKVCCHGVCEEAFARRFSAERYLMRKLLVEFDLAGAEWVITAHLSAEPAMLKVFRDGMDPHVATACLMFDVTADAVREDERLHEGSQDTLRQRGKRSNHSLNYGLGYKQYAMRYEMPEAEGKRLRELYHTKAYPRVSGGLWKRGARAQPDAGYWPWVQDRIRRTGRLEDCFGGVRDFYSNPGEELWLDAYAHLPQCTVSQVIRRGMVHVYRDEPHAELLAQDHDSITVQIPPEPALVAETSVRIMAALSPELCYNDIPFTLGVDAKVGYCRNKLRMVKLQKFMENPECLSE